MTWMEIAIDYDESQVSEDDLIEKIKAVLDPLLHDIGGVKFWEYG